MTPETRILFIDDEPQILLALRRMLRPMRDQWDMHFAEGSVEAIALLQESEFDVVVTDMQMPGMSGADLLGEVARLVPSAVRIVLSGQAREGDLLDTVNTAHQFLAKPCDAEQLKTAIGRAAALHDTVQAPALVEALSGIQSLPSFPAAYHEIMQVMNSEDPSIERVGRIVASDPAMSAKVLQLTNSSFFGLARTIGDPIQATAMLGLQHVLELVITLHIVRELEDAVVDAEFLWMRSERLSRSARWLAGELGVPSADAAFARAAGLLSAAGPLILSSEYPEEWLAALERSAGTHLVDPEVESETFGASSDEATAYLLGLWGLPPSIIEAVAFHRRPSFLPAQDAVRPVDALHLAAALDCAHEPALEIDSSLVERLGVQDKVDQWAARIGASEDQEDGAEAVPA